MTHTPWPAFSSKAAHPEMDFEQPDHSVGISGYVAISLPEYERARVAVNAHDELVAALQRVVDLYVCRIATDPRANEKEEPEEIIFARAALAKVQS